MKQIDSFELPKWIELHKNATSLMLAGSATPSLSIKDLIQISGDKQKTSWNLSLDSIKMALGPPSGSEALRIQIAGLYSDVITADQLLATNGTTGANSLVMQSLLRSGDHVIAMYPSYTQLLSVPRAIPGVELSFWELDTDNQMQTNVRFLESLIKPNTRMIVLNNPNNPLGTTLSLGAQREIAALAHSHGLVLMVDEIFRPLFHDAGVDCPPSFVELSEHYQNIVVTGSLSKAWGLPGARVGWIATRNPTFLAQCAEMGLYSIMALSTLDEAVATEALSDRCRPRILKKHLELARTNIGLLSDFVDQNQKVCSWTRPNAGATAFIRFYNCGAFVDDVDFCLKLLERHGVLTAPGSRCFGLRDAQDFRGFVRFHLTVQQEVMQSALNELSDFVAYYCYKK